MWAGADTHADTVHVALLDIVGKPIADAEFPTTATGYRAAVACWTSRGRIGRVGIEGTSSYGAGLTAAVVAAGIEVLEVNRPSKSDRRRVGKSDLLDAYHAARAVLSGHVTSAPKDPAIAAIRSLHNARRAAVKARTATRNLIQSTLVSAPEPIRAKYRQFTEKTLVDALARCRPTASADPITRSVLTALKMLAERDQFLTAQADALTVDIDTHATAANPALRAAHGVGPDTAAQLLITAGTNPDRLRTEAAFAALCGVSPVPASSGKTNRHRLSRGGDRHANSALHRIALVRMSSHAPTRAFVARQRQAGRSKPETLRILKRAIAREVFRLLTGQVAIPSYNDLRPARQARNITVTAAANHFGVWPTVISRLERGLQRDDSLAATYRTWLTAA